jgi:predicted NBD/HSP70 family sugar kinase
MATFDEGISETLSLLRRKGGMTRSEIVAETGLSRSAVNLRIDALLEARLVTGSARETMVKGRPAEVFSFNNARGKLLAADVGATKFRAGLCNMGGDVESEIERPSDVSDGPEVLLASIVECFESLLDETGTDAAEIVGIGMSLPAPVKRGSGMSVNPPIMPLWNRFDVPAWFGERFACPVFLEKDANAMAYGEARFSHPDADDVLLVKIGTGIGSGLIREGRLFRGADGAAGDLGHIPMTLPGDDEGPLCKCGNRGCLEARAGGWAILRDLQETGAAVESQDDLIAALAAGDPTAVQLARRAGQVIGTAVATAVNLLNPRVVVLAGHLVAAGGDHLLPAIRERVYARSLPLATADLSIVASSLHPREGLVGLAHLVSDGILEPAQIGRLVDREGAAEALR